MGIRWTASPVLSMATAPSRDGTLVEHAGKAIIVINERRPAVRPWSPAKVAKAKRLKPDLVIGIGQDSELNAVLNEAANLLVTRLPPRHWLGAKLEGGRPAAARGVPRLLPSGCRSCDCNTRPGDDRGTSRRRPTLRSDCLSG